MSDIETISMSFEELLETTSKCLEALEHIRGASQFCDCHSFEIAQDTIYEHYPITHPNYNVVQSTSKQLISLEEHNTRIQDSAFKSKIEPRVTNRFLMPICIPLLKMVVYNIAGAKSNVKETCKFFLKFG